MDCLHGSRTHARWDQLIIGRDILLAKTNSAYFCTPWRTHSTFVSHKLCGMQCFEVLLSIETFVGSVRRSGLVHLLLIVLSLVRKLFYTLHLMKGLSRFLLWVVIVHFIKSRLLPQTWLCVGNLADPKSNPSKLDDVVEFSFVAKLTKLTQRLPDFGVGRIEALLVNLVRVVDPVAVVGVVNESNPGIVVQILVVLVHYTRQVVEALELNLVLEPIQLHCSSYATYVTTWWCTCS